ncbi:MAG: methyltransferase, partial [Pseudomonadota bacterium]
VEMPVGAFLQATPQGEAAIVDAVLDRVIGRSNVADLFSGIGTISLALAKHAKVAAFEGSRPAIDALTKARQAKGAHGVTTHHRDLFRRPLSAAELAAYDAIVLDPPRAGAKAQCMELAKSKVAEIAFVSCNPNTFARDARLLANGGYRLEAIQPIGQFLWSNHVELVARFCGEGAY